MIAEAHPVLDALATHPTFTFALVGSRLVEKARMIDTNVDWDFLIDGSGDHSTEKYQRAYTEIEDWLHKQGFKKVMKGGYSEDSGIYHYQWTPENHREHAPVDVMVTLYKGEFERRMRVMEMMKARYGSLRKALRKNSPAWGDLFALLAAWEKA